MAEVKPAGERAAAPERAGEPPRGAASAASRGRRVSVSESLDLRELLAAVGDAVVVTDGAGAITLWNPAAERMFGYTESEALGASLDLIIPERLRGRHWDGYHETMRSGITKYGTTLLRVPATHRDGSQLSIAFTVAMLHDADGRPSAVAAVIRDETSKFNEDRALRKRLAELEAKLAAYDQK
jgi:PAS domain S-box-containing protein